MQKGIGQGFAADAAPVRYADLHCDSMTECCGGDIYRFRGQVNIQKLKVSGCLAQCFALFTEGENAAGDFERYLAFYNAQTKNCPDLLPVARYSDIERAESEGKIAAILTVENLGFLRGETERIARLKTYGVQMASLVWNNQNEFAYPNIIMRGGVPDFSANERRGLKAKGVAAVEELNANKIIVDISHISDGGADEILAISTAPVVASHSNCRAVCPVSRNLSDAQLKKIADKGGVVGLNFCRDFVGAGSAFENLYRHLIHMIDVGGEDLPSLGSDFDGIPPYEEMSDCLKVPALFNYFADRGVKPRIIEKLALKNFLRVFKEVVG